MSTPAVGSVDYWAWVNDRSWGSYITGVEAAAIEAAAAAAEQAVPAPPLGLDVGAGGGRWTGLLLDRGWQVTATDVDAEALARCADLHPAADVRLVDPGEERLPAADGSVALVTCIEVQAVTHSGWFLPEVRRVLAPGGRMVTLVWNRVSLRGALADVGARVRDRRPHTHYRLSYGSWRAGLRAVGLEVVDERGLCWLPFGRSSDSPLVPVGAALERRLGLHRLPRLSPWVVVTAQRPERSYHAPHP
ncbi:class I SAM-dependent methyltransferase [Blastococcus sp. SYSU D00820]